MLTKIHIQSFKSLEDVEVLPGQINILVGANGSGKSNFLESIGVLSAASDGRVIDSTLMSRGVRPGVPKLYKSSFKGSKPFPHIALSAYSNQFSYEVALHNPLAEPSPAWKFKKEVWSRIIDNSKIVSRGVKDYKRVNNENSLAALKIAELESVDTSVDFLRSLQRYVIYSPTTPVLRGTQLESFPSHPLGLSGGRLPEAIREVLLSRSKLQESNKEQSSLAKMVCSDALGLIDWAEMFGAESSSNLPLSPAAAASPMAIRFRDKYMATKRDILSGFDASEGALYILFLAVLAAHVDSPNFLAIDNVDHGLNPNLAKRLISKFTTWILENGNKQVFLTAHNPGVLDGLPLNDDRVRLFTVDRDNKGKTIINRVVITPEIISYAEKGYTLSRLWMNKLIGGMPNV